MKVPERIRKLRIWFHCKESTKDLPDRQWMMNRVVGRKWGELQIQVFL